MKPVAIFVVFVALAAAPLFGQDYGIGYWRFEEGDPDTQAVDPVPDWSPLNNQGTPFGGPIYRADVPFPVVPLTGDDNTLSLEFDGVDDEVVFDSMFPFHDPIDATIEFWIKITHPGHRPIFWTRLGDTDTNRYNIFTHDGAIGFDYRSPTGVRHAMMPEPHDVYFIGYDVWAHVAIARTGNEYSLFVDGINRAIRTDPNPDLPTSVGWQLSGRGIGILGAIIDEVRFSDQVLDPSQFLNAGLLVFYDGFESGDTSAWSSVVP
jgi:hypothetical protein